MPGLYLHIPFCPSRCIYCDFYSTTQLQRREQYVEALCREIQSSDTRQPVQTIYLGGGTPSQLSHEQLSRIFHTIYNKYHVSPEAEVTLEANPDDLTPAYVQALRTLPVNRLSIGVQTFDDSRLRLLRRRHTAAQAAEAVRRARQAGLANVSIDLMFGFPGQTLAQWEADIDSALSLGVQHVSAYSLMLEDGTALTRMVESGQLREPDEETARQMYALLISRLCKAGFDHYEISNFALPGFRSRHNSSYWNDTPYQGFGAAAHSYDGRTRSWNPSDLDAYLRLWSQPRTAAPACAAEEIRESETLTDSQRYDERVLTRLRTREGIDLDALRRDFGDARLRYLLRLARPHVEAGRLRISPDGQRLALTPEGILVSNCIMADLMLAE